MAQLPDGEPAPKDGSLPSSSLVDIEKRTFHAYLHIPFCATRCGYCDFNTYTATELPGVNQKEFTEVIAREINFSVEVLERINAIQRPLASIFFGGGTPTLLPAAQIASLVSKLESSFGIEENAEVSIEANPDTVDEAYLEVLKVAGVNRVSFGMQSASPNILSVLDRTHRPENVVAAVAAAKRVGLQTSVDLIYGAPTETLEDWQFSLNAALDLETDHISAYSLILEKGTKLYRQVASGQLPQPDEDLQAEKYELTDRALQAAGFAWYEVSNWSKNESRRSRHNMAYWKSQDWWGFGPGAHSHFGGVRWWNQKHPGNYATELQKGNSPALAREELAEGIRLEEKIMLELRLAEGLYIETLREYPGFKPEVVAALISDGLIVGEAAINHFIVLTLNGRLLADLVLRRLLGIT